MESTKIVKNGCYHVTHSEEQLKRFLDAGWEVVKETKKATKTTQK